MGLQTRQIEFDDNGIIADFTLSEASIAHAIRKGVLAIKARSEHLDGTTASVEEFTYVNCLSVADGSITYVEKAPSQFWPEGYDPEEPEPVIVNIQDLELVDFLALPAVLGADWVAVTYALNPSWRVGATPPDEKLGEANGDDE